MALSLQEAFSSLKDPRVDRHKRHMLIDIIILAICAVISGADGWEAIEQFGKNKEDWLKKWIDLDNGIPSHDCIARVIASAVGWVAAPSQPNEIGECWVAKKTATQPCMIERFEEQLDFAGGDHYFIQSIFTAMPWAF